MQPSFRIDEKFAAWTAATSDGRILNGLLERRSDEQVVLKLSDGKLITISTKDIDDFRKSPVSLMPEGILADLSPGEAADLLSYLGSFAAVSDR